MDVVCQDSAPPAANNNPSDEPQLPDNKVENQANGDSKELPADTPKEEDAKSRTDREDEILKDVIRTLSPKITKTSLSPAVKDPTPAPISTDTTHAQEEQVKNDEGAGVAGASSSTEDVPGRWKIKLYRLKPPLRRISLPLLKGISRVPKTNQDRKSSYPEAIAETDLAAMSAVKSEVRTILKQRPPKVAMAPSKVENHKEVQPSSSSPSSSSSSSDSSDEGHSDEAKDELTPFTPTNEMYGKRGSMRRTSLAVAMVATGLDVDALTKDIHTKNPRGRVSNNWESWDYHEPHNKKFFEDKAEEDAKSVKTAGLMRWGVSFFIGLFVAVIAFLVWCLINGITRVKFSAIYSLLSQCDHPSCLFIPALMWVFINVVLVFIGSYVVTYHAPLAAGSGIPQVKCYLNGIRMPGLMSLKTLAAKAGGVVLSVSGGLLCGKEGPMIHSGAICASAIARGECSCKDKTLKPMFLNPMRSDQERRDFVAAGAASGVSAAFASPVGGVLFSMEEGASFMSQGLTWRMIFSSAVATLVLSFLMSLVLGTPGDMSNPGLVSFGFVGDVDYQTFEMFIFLGMAIFGGLSGALFVVINYHNTLFRRRALNSNSLKVSEAVLVSALSALILLGLIYIVPDCAPIRGFDQNATVTLQAASGVHKRSVDDPSQGNLSEALMDESTSDFIESPYGYHGHGYVVQAFCDYGYHSRMADLLFKTPEGGLHTMLHAPLDEYSIGPLLVLFVVYHLLATWTYGLSVSSGVFIPSLLIGAIWGRIIGILVMKTIPAAGVNISKYCIIGAGAQLGGTVRMTISLAVILIECIGDITFGIPIIVTLMVAKWTGDFFITGIYDLHIEVWGAPLLGWDAPRMCHFITAGEVMSTPVAVLRCKERLSTIARILHNPLSHNGFPVVEDYDPDAEHNGYGRMRGFILKSQLRQAINFMGHFDLSEEADGHFDLTDFMDRCPYTVYEDQSLPRIFRIFRVLGLRHLPVINTDGNVVGVLTRVNLARFREEASLSKLKVEELHVVDE